MTVETIALRDATGEELWLHTADGAPRGYIEARQLEEVWLHTGTACNLACPFCLEGSKPGDDRLQLMTLADAAPFIDEAVALGAKGLSFTGGEPFVAREMHRILAYAAARLPCLVLTNATAPLLQRIEQITPLAQAAHRIRFRVSLDYPNAQQHDAGRGAGTFAEALSTMRALHDLGFELSIARQCEAGEDAAAVEGRFRDLLVQHGLPRTLNIVSFPDFHPPGSAVQTPHISEDCMTRFHDADSRARFMCAFSRMVVKRDGRLRVYACTLVDDDPRYDLGGTLAESLGPRVMLAHHRCFSCFRLGASCSER